jgi:hypothetical protein
MTARQVQQQAELSSGVFSCLADSLQAFKFLLLNSLLQQGVCFANPPSCLS